jgi:hypothetical protein
MALAYCLSVSLSTAAAADCGCWSTPVLEMPSKVRAERCVARLCGDGEERKRATGMVRVEKGRKKSNWRWVWTSASFFFPVLLSVSLYFGINPSFAILTFYH